MKRGESRRREGGATARGETPQLINQCQTPQRRIQRRGEEKSVTGDIETEDGSVGCKDERRQKRIIDGGAGGEVNKEGQCVLQQVPP